MQVEVERAGSRIGVGRVEGAGAAEHGEDGGEGVCVGRWGGVEGDMENWGGVDDIVDCFVVIYSYGFIRQPA